MARVRLFFLSVAWGFFSSIPADIIAAENLGVTVPEGFEVTLFADDDLAHDIYNMTLDSRGRVVVSGPGYVRILLDEDGDGHAEKVKNFSEVPAQGAMGLYFFGRDLICVGDGGLLRLRDQDVDDRADGPPEVFLKFKTGGEHDAHAIRKGPDGAWYLIAGNTTEINAAYVTNPRSPVRHPEFGTILRLAPDLSSGEVLTHGFRNAFDFDFSARGDIFTFDSDDERDSSLPWYRPTRVFQAMAGTHAGWLSKSWKRPDYFLDMPPVLAAFGRGSPTGVACYRHTQFPEPYRGCLFVFDWTFGRGWALPLQNAGEIVQTKPIDFMQAEGEFGFAPTDAEVGPDGSLYVSVGGRGTRGGVYRITHTKGLAEQKRRVAPKPPLELVLSAPQPLSSWSRADWEPLAKQVGREPILKAVLDDKRPEAERVRGLEILVEMFGGVSASEAPKIAQAKSGLLRGRLAWALERQPVNELSETIWIERLADSDAFARRIACETLTTYPPEEVSEAFESALIKVLGDEQRFVRLAASRLISRLTSDQLNKLGARLREGNWETAIAFGYGLILALPSEAPQFVPPVVEIAQRVLEQEVPVATKLEASRLLQLGVGDLGLGSGATQAFHGYASQIDLTPYDNDLAGVNTTVTKLFPGNDPQLDEELSRLLAILQVPNEAALSAILAKITPESSPVSDTHYLVVAARIPCQRGMKERAAIARALITLEPKLDARKLVQDTNWPDRIIDIFQKLVELDPELPFALLEDPQFGRPGHTLYLGQFPPELLPKAREKFFQAIKADPNYPWNNEVVFLFGSADGKDYLPLLRDRYEHLPTRNAALVSLSKVAAPEDREKFFQGLETYQPEVLQACLDALKKMPPAQTPSEMITLVKAARRLGTEAADFPIRERVIGELERATRQRIPFIKGAAGYRPQPQAIQAWTQWAIDTFPKASVELQGSASQEVEALKKELKDVNWEAGDVARGGLLFQARSCSQCHGSRQALGPSLSGVAGRFSREDLFLAIVWPDRDVSPRYQATTIETESGRVHTGLIIYESAEGLILRNPTNQTLRFETTEIASKTRQQRSLMPTGLLKDLKPEDLADLYAYLQSLGAKK